MIRPHLPAIAATLALHALAGIVVARLTQPTPPAPQPTLQAHIVAAMHSLPAPHTLQPLQAARGPARMANTQPQRGHQEDRVPQAPEPSDATYAAAARVPGPLATVTEPSAEGVTSARAEPPGAATPPHHSTPRVVTPQIDASWTGNRPPAYPPAARRLGEQGAVHLDVHVGADGSVLTLQLRRSSGSERLDRSAMEALRRWRFIPAQHDGQPTAAWYRDWQWIFKLEG